MLGLYLEEIIGELKEPVHTVFIMRAILDYRFKEIGEMFQKSENWARVTFYRTRVKLIERIKIPCDIILDLLPIYVDDVCSEVSREEIKRHLKTCPNCLKKYQQMTINKNLETDYTEAILPLKK